MYTSVAELQGEIGASTVEGRDKKIKLRFGRYMFKTGNGLLKTIIRRMCWQSKPGRWMQQLREYMGELEISFDRLESMTKLELDRVVDKWETDRWRRDLESRTTLQLYRNKVGICEEGIYIEMCLGQCSCFDVELILWSSDGGMVFLEVLWTACCVELRRRLWSILRKNVRELE